MRWRSRNDLVLYSIPSKGERDGKFFTVFSSASFYHNLCYNLTVQILTRREVKLLAFVLGALLVGLAVQHWRGKASLQPYVDVPAQQEQQ